MTKSNEQKALSIAETKVLKPSQSSIEYCFNAFGIAFIVCAIFTIVSALLGHSTFSSEVDDAQNIAIPISAFLFSILAFWKSKKDWKDYENDKQVLFEEALWNLENNESDV